MKPKDLKKWIAQRQLQSQVDWLKKEESVPDYMTVIALPIIFRIVYLNLN